MILILFHYSCSSRRWKDMKKNEQMCQKVIIVFSFSLRFVGTKCCLNQHYGATSWTFWDYTHLLFSFAFFVSEFIYIFMFFNDFHTCPSLLSFLGTFMSGFKKLFCLAWIPVNSISDWLAHSVDTLPDLCPLFSPNVAEIRGSAYLTRMKIAVDFFVILLNQWQDETWNKTHHLHDCSMFYRVVHLVFWPTKAQ